jgi:signal transduction histidine kinase
VLDWSRAPEPLPRSARWAVFGVLVVFVAAGLARRVPDDALLGALGAIVAVGFGAVAFLGRAAFIPPAVLGATAGIAVLGHGMSSNVAWFGLPTLVAWCALATPLAVTAGYWAVAVLLLCAEAIFTSHDPGWAAWVGGTCFAAVGCLFGRRQRDLVAQLRDAQAGLAQRAQAEERNRIARELHDVIAHSLTVSLMHVTSARLAVRDDPADAERALAEAERLGRNSLDEVRHVVGLLRHADSPDPATPLPGSVDVPTLIERFRAAGADVNASIEGDLTSLPGTVGLAAYRILQEALTNATKHAPATRATVYLAVRSDVVCLDVDSSGAPGRGTGLGLIGMRERAQALGGTLEAGPGGSGWLVHAELPLTSAAPS